MYCVHIVCLVMTMAVAFNAEAQDMPVPVDLQQALFQKILSYDRALVCGSSGKTVIGIIYQSRYITSRNVGNSFAEALEKSPDRNLPGRTIEYALIDIMDKNIDELVAKYDPDVLYVTPMRAMKIGEIAVICRSRGILSITGVPEYCHQGLSVGIGEQKGRPRIIINLAASRAEGADFSAQLLKLATIIGEKPE